MHEPGAPLFFSCSVNAISDLRGCTHTDTDTDTDISSTGTRRRPPVLSTRCSGYLLAGSAPGTSHLGRGPRLSRGPSRQSRVPRQAVSFHSTCALLFLEEAQVSQNLTTAAHPAICNLQSASSRPGTPAPITCTVSTTMDLTALLGSDPIADPEEGV